MWEHIKSNARDNVSINRSPVSWVSSLPWLGSCSIRDSLQKAIILCTVCRRHGKHRAKTVNRLREGKVEAFADCIYSGSKTGAVWASQNKQQELVVAPVTIVSSVCTQLNLAERNPGFGHNCYEAISLLHGKPWL